MIVLLAPQGEILAKKLCGIGSGPNLGRIYWPESWTYIYAVGIDIYPGLLGDRLPRYLPTFWLSLRASGSAQVIPKYLS